MSQSPRKLFRVQSRLGKVWSFILLLWLFLWPVAYLRGTAGGSATAIRFVLLLLLIVLGIPLGIRVLRGKLLWKLRNRLVVNYLLIGLAPFILLLTLFALLGYSLAGQFAIVAATTELNESINFLASQNRALASHATHDLKDGKLTVSAGEIPQDKDQTPNTISVWVDDKYVPVQGAAAPSQAVQMTPPAWTNGEFNGVVLDGNRMFIRAVDTVRENG